jgi:hypothetical protein
VERSSRWLLVLVGLVWRLLAAEASRGEGRWYEGCILREGACRDEQTDVGGWLCERLWMMRRIQVSRGSHHERSQPGSAASPDGSRCTGWRAWVRVRVRGRGRELRQQPCYQGSM